MFGFQAKIKMSRRNRVVRGGLASAALRLALATRAAFGASLLGVQL